MAAANSLAEDDRVSVVVSGAVVWSLAALSKSVGDTAFVVGAVVVVAAAEMTL